MDDPVASNTAAKSNQKELFVASLWLRAQAQRVARRPRTMTVRSRATRQRRWHRKELFVASLWLRAQVQGVARGPPMVRTAVSGSGFIRSARLHIRLLDASSGRPSSPAVLLRAVFGYTVSVHGSSMIAQGLSWAGALMILGAYAAQQLGWLKPVGAPHAVLNLMGGGLVAGVAALTHSPSVVMLEGTWALISAAALARALRAWQQQKAAASR